MTRREFWKWMETCPSDDWLGLEDEVETIKIHFPVNEDPEENEA